MRLLELASVNSQMMNGRRPLIVGMPEKFQW